MRRPRSKRNLAVDIVVLLVAAVFCIAVFQAAQSYYYRYAYPIKYSQAVERESIKNDLPLSLVYAVIRTESSFRPEVESSIGARGLMQITEETYDWTAYRLGEKGGKYETLFDGETNIRYGTALLRLLLDEFGTPENALCAYHAGWGNAKKWLGNQDHSPDGENIVNIPFGDTARYVEKVLETQKRYRELYQIE